MHTETSTSTSYTSTLFRPFNADAKFTNRDQTYVRCFICNIFAICKYMKYQVRMRLRLSHQPQSILNRNPSPLGGQGILIQIDIMAYDSSHAYVACATYEYENTLSAVAFHRQYLVICADRSPCVTGAMAVAVDPNFNLPVYNKQVVPPHHVPFR